jgi:hypothetical protein
MRYSTGVPIRFNLGYLCIVDQHQRIVGRARPRRRRAGAIPNTWIQPGERKQRVFYEFPGGELIAEAQVDDPATPGCPINMAAVTIRWRR